jgi:hypothetical protein
MFEVLKQNEEIRKIMWDQFHHMCYKLQFSTCLKWPIPKIVSDFGHSVKIWGEKKREMYFGHFSPIYPLNFVAYVCWIDLIKIQ